MVWALATSGDGIQVVLAKAGAGKTTALDAAREAWERSGVRVQGTALASYATKELRDSGIPATTIARLLVDIEQHGLPPRSVLIVDEAGMVGTRTLHRLAALMPRRRTRSSSWPATTSSSPRSTPAERSAASPSDSAPSSSARTTANAIRTIARPSMRTEEGTRTPCWTRYAAAAGSPWVPMSTRRAARSSVIGGRGHRSTASRTSR